MTGSLTGLNFLIIHNIADRFRFYTVKHTLSIGIRQYETLFNKNRLFGYEPSDTQPLRLMGNWSSQHAMVLLKQFGDCFGDLSGAVALKPSLSIRLSQNHFDN